MARLSRYARDTVRRPDLWIAAAVVALCAWAVYAQVGRDPVGEAEAARPVRTLGFGEALEDQDVVALDGKPYRLHGFLGRKATVFYSWSTRCPCVDQVNPRLLPLIQRFKPQGVAFLAVAGDPADTKEVVAVQHAAAWSREAATGGLPPFGLLLDPTQRLCRQLGFREASQFVVVDGNGYVRYRGTIDDDLKRPTKPFLLPALEAVFDGRVVESPLRPVPGYGCAFGAPLKDCPYLAADAEARAR